MLNWLIEGRRSAVDGPVARGDFAGLRMFDFFLSAAEMLNAKESIEDHIPPNVAYWPLVSRCSRSSRSLSHCLIML